MDYWKLSLILKRLVNKKHIPDNINKILAQVPPDYYAKGVQTNYLQKYWHNKKWFKLKEYLQGLGKSRLLDVGCADGTTTKQIARRLKNFKITGIDLYSKSIGFAKKNNEKINFRVADTHNLPFKNQSFDVVTAIETLEHMSQPRLALSEIYRVLKKAGFLIVIQDTDSLLFRSIWWLWTKWKGSVWKNSHLSCVKPEELLNMIKKTGFKIEKVEYINLRMELVVKAYKK